MRSFSQGPSYAGSGLFFFWPQCTACGVLVLQPGQQWKHRVLPTGAPGNSQSLASWDALLRVLCNSSALKGGTLPTGGQLCAWSSTSTPRTTTCWCTCCTWLYFKSKLHGLVCVNHTILSRALHTMWLNVAALLKDVSHSFHATSHTFKPLNRHQYLSKVPLQPLHHCSSSSILFWVSPHLLHL